MKFAVGHQIIGKMSNIMSCSLPALLCYFDANIEKRSGNENMKRKMRVKSTFKQ